MATVGIYERQPIASIQRDGQPVVYFPIRDIKKSFKNGAVKHRRFGRKGERGENTGRPSPVWTFQIPIINGSNEEGLPPNQYPKLANDLETEFDHDDPVSVTLPTHGVKRGWIDGYERADDASSRDSCVFDVTFWEDNGDDTAALAFSQPSPMSNVVHQSISATDAAEDLGATSDLFTSINSLARQIEGYAQAPGDYLDDIDAKARALNAAINGVEDAFTDAANDATNEFATLLTDPAASRAGMLFTMLGDTVSRTARAIVPVGPGIVQRTYQRDVSIFGIAGELKQNALKLLAINSQLPSPTHIRAGTPVNVYTGPVP